MSWIDEVETFDELVKGCSKINVWLGLSIPKNDREVGLYSISVPLDMRQQGIGRAVMNKVVHLADKQDHRIYIIAAAVDPAYRDMIVKWCHSLGFEFDDEKSVKFWAERNTAISLDYTGMTRLPARAVAA